MSISSTLQIALFVLLPLPYGHFAGGDGFHFTHAASFHVFDNQPAIVVDVDSAGLDASFCVLVRRLTGNGIVNCNLLTENEAARLIFADQSSGIRFLQAAEELIYNRGSQLCSGEFLLRR